MKSKYRKTSDAKEMMTNKEIDDAIENDWENIKDFLPCQTSTYVEYKAGATTALVWNEGEKTKTMINLPLGDGWYTPDMKYGIPNGKQSNYDDKNAI